MYSSPFFFSPFSMQVLKMVHKILKKRLLADIEDQVKDILSLVFENYKSLDESSPTGMMEVFRPASGSVAPALVPAVKLYTLLHDILSPEAQLKFCRYFQVMDTNFSMPAWSFQYFLCI